MGGDEAMESYEICMGANLTCMNDLMNRMGKGQLPSKWKKSKIRIFISGEFDHVDYNGKQTKCRSACEDQVWHEIFRKLWSRNFYICCQVNSLFVTTSSYPNRKTLIYREEFCIITKRLIKKCRSYKRKPLDREYPHLCNLIQPLEFIE